MESRHPVLPPAEQSANAARLRGSAVEGSLLVPGHAVPGYRIVSAVRRADEEEHEGSQTSRSWKTGGVFLAIFVLAAGATFGFVCVYTIRAMRSASSLGPVSTNRIAVDKSREDLGLHVEPSGHRLLITWNLRAAAVENASTGTLQIDDGTRHRTLNLDANQIHTGVISYRTSTGDISLELSFADASGNSRTESYRILDDALAGSPERKLEIPQTFKVAEQTKGEVGVQYPPVTSAAPLQAVSPDEKAAPAKLLTEQLQAPADAASPRTVVPGNQTASQDKGNPPSPSVLNVSASLPNGGVPAPNTISPASGLALTKPAQQGPEAPPFSQMPGRPVAPASEVSIPKPLTMVNPNASSLRSARISHPCELRLYAEIDETGRVTSARPLSVDRALGPEMVVASIAAARQWKFVPARSSAGVPFRSHYSIVFRFQPARQ